VRFLLEKGLVFLGGAIRGSSGREPPSRWPEPLKKQGPSPKGKDCTWYVQKNSKRKAALILKEVLTKRLTGKYRCFSDIVFDL
jgi:hypothetical protein